VKRGKEKCLRTKIPKAMAKQDRTLQEVLAEYLSNIEARGYGPRTARKMLAYLLDKASVNSEIAESLNFFITDGEDS
jgi:hypothetical protein